MTPEGRALPEKCRWLACPRREGEAVPLISPSKQPGTLPLGEDVCNCLSLLGMRTSGPEEEEGTAGCWQSVTPLDSSPLRCTCLAGTFTLAQHLAPSSSSQPQRRPRSPCSGELPAGDVPPALRAFAVQAPATPDASSKTRVLENIHLVASAYWEKT